MFLALFLEDDVLGTNVVPVASFFLLALLDAECSFLGFNNF